jgi:hypothetical protein
MIIVPDGALVPWLLGIVGMYSVLPWIPVRRSHCATL